MTLCLEGLETIPDQQAKLLRQQLRDVDIGLNQLPAYLLQHTYSTCQCTSV